MDNIKKKCSEINNFIKECLEVPKYYDYLNSNVNLDLKLYENFSDKEVLTELLNASHEEGDIFLSIDLAIYREGSKKDIKLTIYKKLLSKIVELFLQPPNISEVFISNEHREYLKDKIQLYILKDYFVYGIEEIPPYRVWNNKEEEMTYFDSVPIDNEIKTLKGKISEYVVKENYVSERNKNFINKFYHNWWIEYKGIINEYYEGIEEKFLFFNGIKVNVVLAEMCFNLPSNFSSGDLALCTGRSDIKNTERDFEIEVNEEIHHILFLEDYFTDDEYVTVDMGFDLDVYEKDFDKVIRQDAKNEVRERLLGLFKRNYDNIIFDIFSKKVLSLMGIHIKDKSNGEVAIQYNFNGNQFNSYKVIKLSGDSKVYYDILQEHIKDEENLLIISSSLFSNTVRDKYKERNEIKLVDIEDLINFLQKIPNNTIKNKINRNLIYPFLRNELQKEETDFIYYKGQDLINKLKKCPIGKKGWRKFEDICVDIIDFVFRDSFNNFKVKVQSTDYYEEDIRDAILYNTGKNEFWKRIMQTFDANNIVIEFKNLNDGVGKNEIVQVSDYLDKPALGRFGMIFSRNGVSKGGTRKQYQILNRDRNNKMILVLNENDIIDLIKKKMLNEDPEQILEDLEFDLTTKT